MYFACLRPRLAAGGKFVILLLVLAGCQKEDDIRHYTAPKPESPTKQRLLGAIFPRGDELLVFKLIGPESAVTEHQAEFDSFIDSVTFKDGDKMPTYETPKTWHPSKGTQFSVAAFRVGPDEHAPELTITPSRGSVKENIVRWRGQFNLKSNDDDEIKRTSKEKQIGGVTATLVDLTGTGSGGMGQPPFAGKAPHPPIEATAEATHPIGREGGPGPSPLKYTVPEGWTEGQQTPYSLASFQAGEGRDAVKITVTALGGAGGGLRSNINRWRQQAGLGPWTEEQFTKESATLMIAGVPAVCVDLIGKGEAAGQRITGAVLSYGGKTWFFKMIGPADAVGQQKPAFEAFVKSVRFKGDAANE